jgi:integrase
MVVKVKLDGLNVRQSRGKWYVSYRKTGETLLKGWEGTRDGLHAEMATAEFLRKYTSAKTRDRRPVYGEGTLGGLVKWFKESPRWTKLSDASRADYEKTFLYLEPEFDMEIAEITQESVYEARDTASKAKWPRFADKMVSHLSTMFRSKRLPNPALGIEKLHAADPNANHEWTPGEVEEAISGAPAHILTPLILARYQGFRGQTCQSLSWRAYVSDPVTVKAITLTVRKNKELAWFPCEPETIAHLDSIPRPSIYVCTTSEGRPWKDEKSMQHAVSEYLTGLKAKGIIREGCTLHGLRVTFAAAIRRLGIDPSTVSDALGDRSKQMGEHYTRHVEKEAGRLRAWRARNGQ